MIRLNIRSVACLILMLTLASLARAEKLDGADLALKSSGEATGRAWRLSKNGFVGTYIKLDRAGEVKLTLSASTEGSAKVSIVIGDAKLSSDAASVQLPAGTHFIRIEHANHASGDSVTIESIEIDGAKLLNEHNDANALAAADTFIEHFRRGGGVVNFKGVAGVSPGAQVRVKLRKHGFTFGTAVAGFETGELFDPSAPSGSDAAKYQAAIKSNFNAIVPGNAGKWVYNEKQRDVNTMDFIDQLRAFAKDNGLRMRMHALLWNTGQEPKFITDLVDAAANGDANARRELRDQISERIRYYVRDRAASYDAIDVLNEAYHQPKYWQIFGPEGIADIHRECATAIADAGASTKLFINEYNVLQYSQSFPFKDGQADPYANWFREMAEIIQSHGGPVHGIGVQYYPLLRANENQPHSPARMFGVFQNLSISGLPITLTEFGVQTKGGVTRVPETLDETVRIVFGSPGCDGFFMWGFWRPELWSEANGAAFFEKDWSPTEVYEAWTRLMSKWTTDETLTVGPDGTVRFTGFFGDYEVTVDGNPVMRFTHEKGKTTHGLATK